MKFKGTVKNDKGDGWASLWRETNVEKEKNLEWERERHSSTGESRGGVRIG